MEGQTVLINMDSKVLQTQLNNRFQFAGQIMKWSPHFSCEAFGVNRSIVNFVIGTKFKLLIRYSMEPQREYWINYDHLHSFIKSNQCLNRVGKNKIIYNIPISLFTDKPIFSGAL